MPEISDVRLALYSALKTFADAQTPALRIRIRGQRFSPTDRETWLEQDLLTARPEKVYAGTAYDSRERGIYQVTVVGPESRLQKAIEQVAWDIREHFWPAGQKIAPTLGSDPLVRLGPWAPYVRDHPSPDAGTLASVVDIYWHSDIVNP